MRYNIHGHVHENTIDHPKYINVCYENIDFTPVLFNDILEGKF